MLAAEGRKAVEGAGKGQALDAFLAYGREIDALDEVVDVFELSATAALGEDGFDSRDAYALDGAETETDVAGRRLSSMSLVMVLMSSLLRLITPAMYWAG